MKKLIIISSALIAFSAVNLFANEQTGVSNAKAQAISVYSSAVQDTTPKKDTTKKKDTTSFQLKEKK